MKRKTIILIIICLVIIGINVYLHYAGTKVYVNSVIFFLLGVATAHFFKKLYLKYINKK